MNKRRHSGSPIQALILGSGGIGASVVEQLSKNNRFHITWVGKDLENQTHSELESESVVRVINLDKSPTPLTINDLIEEYRPDIVFFCQRGADWDIEDQVASTNLEREMLGESIIIGDAPIITVSLEQNPHTEA